MYEEELLRQISFGNKDAFKELYDLMSSRVYMYLYNLFYDEKEAREVLIETFSEVWRCAKKFQGRSKVLTWIIGIARNIAITKLKLKNRYESFESIDEQHIGDECASLKYVEKKFQSEILKKAISRLSIKHREILELVYYHEMNYKEVAELLNIPINTVKTRIFYAKERLKKILIQMGVEGYE